MEDAHFKPKAKIPPYITGLATITDAMVSNTQEFLAVCDAFLRFMQKTADEFLSFDNNRRQ
jgi:DNA polymerase III epsilon subunit-like protein